MSITMFEILFMWGPIIIFVIAYIIMSRHIKKISNSPQGKLQKEMDERKRAFLHAVLTGDEDEVVSDYLNTSEERILNTFKNTAVVCTGYIQWAYDENVVATYRSWDGFEREVKVDISPEIARENERLEIKVYVSPDDAQKAMVDREEVLMAIENRKGGF